ncbi:MAG: PIN domain nuclease [Candidatus Daviesbacteria bacterium]|nr:MAG: PIN domain nuclease [Candidatus Daviesbacteria bacterium]
MSIKLILRLVLAVVFATLAIIYSELLPPIEGANAFLLRAAITILLGVIGFAIFPELATRVTTATIHLFNLTITRISTEILNQILRVSRQTHVSQPSVLPTRGSNISNPLIIDTSAIIDGRVLDIAKTGFINGLVLVPNFVLLELQQVADSKSSEKRARGRRGFEIMEELKRVSDSSGAKMKVEVWDKEIKGKDVDEKLVNLTKALNGKILTTDFNLNRLAGAHSVLVLNINDLANALKTIAIPGERLKIKILHLGKDAHQGVGYLADGTMIVVQDGAGAVGKTIEIEVTKILQIPAGRMIFAQKSS